MIELTQPYIPGFLAFREIEFMKMLYENVREKTPKYTPQVCEYDSTWGKPKSRKKLANFLYMYCHFHDSMDILFQKTQSASWVISTNSLKCS